MLVLQTQYTQHVISSIWKTCKYSGTEVTDTIKDNNEIFGIWSTRTEPNQAKFHGTHFKKNKWFAKNFWYFFTKLSQPKCWFWTEPNSSPLLGLQSFLLSCSQLCHHHYFWEFLFNELLQWLFRINHLASKNKLHLEFSLVFWLGSYSTLAWPCHMGRVDTG